MRVSRTFRSRNASGSRPRPDTLKSFRIPPDTLTCSRNNRQRIGPRLVESTQVTAPLYSQHFPDRTLCLRRCYLQPLRGHRRPFDLVHSAIARCVNSTSRRGSGRNVSSAWICATALASASRRRRPPLTPAAIPGWRRLIYVTVTNCRRVPGRIILLLYRHFRRRLAAAELSASSVIRVGLGGALHCSCDCWPAATLSVGCSCDPDRPSDVPQVPLPSAVPTV